jgi:peptidoglycan/LPS O-acetylase OafA/YrhL
MGTLGEPSGAEAAPAPGAADAGGEAPAAAGPDTRLRLAPLDGMRALFLAVVLAHHMVWVAPRFANGWAEGGWAGLDGFFVLSGYLIGSILFREVDRTGTVNYGRFMARRMLRLYPALLVAIAAMVVVSLRVDGTPWADVWPSVRASLLYAMNWPFGNEQPLILDYTHFWSLAVEFHFYLVLPLLLIAMAKLRFPPWAQALVLAVLMALSWWRRSQLWTGIDSFPRPYVFTDARLDGLLWGVVLALALSAGWIGARHRRWLRALAVPALAWTVWAVWTVGAQTGFTYDWAMMINGFAHSVLLAWVLVDGAAIVPRLLGSLPMSWLGLRSYSIYLYHYPLFLFAARHMQFLGERARIVFVLAVLLVLADLSYRFVERPGLALNRRLRERRAPPAVAVEPATT